MRLYRIIVDTDYGSRVTAELQIVSKDAPTAVARAIEHFQMLNNGVDCRVRHLKDEGPVVL